MEDKNATPLQNLIARNKGLSIVILAILLLVPLILLILSLRNSVDSFRLQSVKPAASSSVGPLETTVTFEYNQEMPLVQKDTFSVNVEPKVEFVYGILGNKLTVNLSDLLLVDGQPYTITIKNLVSRSGGVIRSQSSDFTVTFDSTTKDFIEGLPYTGNGFSVVKISDYTLLVEVIKKPEARYETAAVQLLEEKGIDATKFNIDISLPSEQQLKDDDNLIKHYD